MYHVYSYQDRHICFNQLDNRKLTNALADNFADKDLMESVAEGCFISGDIPFDDVPSGWGQSGLRNCPPKSSTTSGEHGLQGRSFTARVFSTAGTLASFTGMERKWRWRASLIFSASGSPSLCPTSVAHNKTTKNICRSCQQPNKTTSHITRCRDPGRTKTLEALVEEIVGYGPSVPTRIL